VYKKVRISKSKYFYYKVNNKKDEEVIFLLNKLYYQERDFLRRHKGYLLSLDCLLENGYQVGDDSFFDYINKLKTYEFLYDAIDKLNEKHKKVIVLYYFYQYSLKQISKIMRITIQSVYELRVNAEKKLKKILLSRY